MRTKMMIGVIVGGCMVVALSVLASLMVWLGVSRGLLAGAMMLATVVATYIALIGPWQRRWGATEEEVRGAMPGDDLLPAEAASSTRAITINAPPEMVFPWLLQIGYGRGGWYSYDWIDNDGRPSVDRILPELQQLAIGDQIVMVPGMGPIVRAIERDRLLLCGDQASGTWCIILQPTDRGGCRLLSRWRQQWKLTPATVPWIAISDPGAFLMERKMLKNLKRLAESDRRVARSSAQPVSNQEVAR